MARSAQKVRGKKLARAKSAHAKSDSMDITSIVGDTSIPVIAFRQLLENCMEEYGKYVVENRAIPCIHDGMKPVHRRVLWGAYAMGAKSSGKTIKTARVVGECFTAGTPISTPNGQTPIEDLILGDLVNTSQGPRKVVGVIENPEAPMYILTLGENHFVVLTKNQEVKIKIGDAFFWKKSCDLDGTELIVVEA